MDSSQNKKRRISDTKPETDTDSDTDLREKAIQAGVPDAWPRFLLVSGADELKPLSKLSVFAIQKGFEGVSSTGFAQIKRLKNGTILVECTSRKASDLLLKRDGSVFVDRKISVSIHGSLNSSRGVIRCAQLKEVPELEIRDNLASQGVLRVQKVYRKGPDSERIATNTLFLTFSMAKLPESIKVAFLRVKVTPFVPSPMRCFTCHRFGHISKFCKETPKCERCGQDKHDGSQCDAVCTNCKGQHSASSRACPRWIQESAIQKVRAEKNISFVEAKKLVLESSTPSDPNSYANRTKCNLSSGGNASASSEAVPSEFMNVMKSLMEQIAKLTAKVEQLEQKHSFCAKCNAQVTASKVTNLSNVRVTTSNVTNLSNAQATALNVPNLSDTQAAASKAVTSKAQEAALKASTSKVQEAASKASISKSKGAASKLSTSKDQEVSPKESTSKYLKESLSRPLTVPSGSGRLGNASAKPAVPPKPNPKVGSAPRPPPKVSDARVEIVETTNRFSPLSDDDFQFEGMDE